MSPAEAAYRSAAEALFHLSPTQDCFNPYADRNPEVDLPDAVERRRSNLRAYLEACRPRPRLFLLAEAPGPWGCRFSGVPITSEAQLLDPGFPFGGEQSGSGEPHGEYSANIFWGLLKDVFPDFVVWNACPLHPHRPDRPFTIRAPRRAELRRFQPLVRAMVSAFQPGAVLAVGRNAEWTLSEAGIPARYVRHPSQGGANAFRAGVKEALEARYHLTGQGDG